MPASSAWGAAKVRGVENRHDATQQRMSASTIPLPKAAGSPSASSGNSKLASIRRRIERRGVPGSVTPHQIRHAALPTKTVPRRPREVSGLRKARRPSEQEDINGQRPTVRPPNLPSIAQHDLHRIVRNASAHSSATCRGASSTHRPLPAFAGSPGNRPFVAPA